MDMFSTPWGECQGGTIAGSYGKSMFSFVRNLQTVSQNGKSISHSHQRCMRVPVAPHPHQHLVILVFRILALLIDVQWYFNVVLICISPDDI